MDEDPAEESLHEPLRSPEDSCSSFSSESSASTSPKSNHEEQETTETPSASTSKQTTKDKSLHVSVQRAEISSTAAREGNEELEELDVEAYDQQTYEEGIFEQVNRALTAVESAATNKRRTDPNCNDSTQTNSTDQNPSNINDLMQIIHDQNDPDAGRTANSQVKEEIDPTERDEQLLQLTRAERLNRRPIKTEPIVPPDSSVSSLPRIPRLSGPSVKQESLTADLIQPLKEANDPQPRPSTSRDTYRPSRPKQFGLLSSGIRLEYRDCDDDGDDSENSSVSEYQPDNGELSDNDSIEGDIDYETDSDLGPNAGQSDGEQKKSRKRTKKMDDDGDFRCYESRIKAYVKKRAKKRLDNILEDGTEGINLDEMVHVEGSLQIPKEIWDNLFEHQKTGVRWLWELHQLGTGGILGDEMGLGKTIQTIAFLTALRCSNIRNTHKGYDNLGPTVLVCPATVMHQWLMEFRKWWPQFRVAILHNTGTFSGDRKKLVSVIHKSRGILIVSYPGVVIYQDYLHDLDWHYAILDEGHKIRNPDAQVTLACKRFRTPHRLILSGSPVQNNLRELWSIFDFIYPGKLGTLPVFMGQFGIPITQGGYANATDIQVQIAYKCACVLRDTIKPFLLRRSKAEVNSKLKLPDRSEQVLFCKLTDKQHRLYQTYLDSPTVRDIKRGMCQIFVGLIQLRKICNHPDIFDWSDCTSQIKQKEEDYFKKHREFFSEDETYGHFKKSGKMMVVDALLKLWKKQGHKVLLFTQSRQMIKIFMGYLGELNYSYLTMDGTTPIGARQTMIEEFNKNEEIFIFLLTTKVGGVGINLIGANRIIIYDPDWNPSTDIQARERAWRIGQQKHVIIYRLITAGTIEEKIYHRQVFKLYLTNRVLKDAKQKRFFKTNDMHELFTLGDNDKNIETKALFDDDLQINPESIERSKRRLKKEKKKRKKDRERDKQESSSHKNGDTEHDNSFLLPEERRQALRERAKLLSQMIAQQYGSKTSDENRQEDERRTEEPTRCTTPVHSVNGLETSQWTSGELHAGSSRSPKHSDLTNGYGKSDKKATSSKKRVDYLVKQDIYRHRDDDDEESRPDKRYKRDDYILERLFKSSNISGALKHDKIETDSTSDFKVVESEAEKVARDAIRALRESRRMCLGSSSGIPNWTGRNGQVASTPSGPRLVPKNRRGLQLVNSRTTVSSSSGSASNSGSNGNDGDSLLASIRKRNQLNSVTLARNTFGVGPSHGSNNNDDDSDEEERNRDFDGRAKDSGVETMADRIREYMLFKSTKNGEAQTDELLELFKQNYQPDKTAIFKAILYKMCDFVRRGDKGFWIIKSEFRS